MGLLEAAGRSGGFGRLTGNILGGAQGLLQTQMTMAEQAAQQKSRDIADRLNETKLKENEARQQLLNRPQNIRNSVLVMSLPEEKRDEFVQKYIAGGYAQPDGTTTMLERNKFLEENKEGVDFYFQGLKENASKVTERSFQKYQTAMISGDPEAIKKAQGEFKNASAYLAGVEGKHKEALDLMGDKPVSVSPGSALVNPNTGQEVFTNKKQPTEAINDFSTFYRGEKEKNPNATEAEISKAWHEMKVKEQKAVGEMRIPAFMPAPAGLPPEYVFNRRTGNYEWKGKGPAPGVALGTAATDYQANKTSLTNITKGTDTIMAFEKGVQQSLDLVDKLSDQIKRGNFPKANSITQAIQYHSGDPRIKGFQNALTTAMTEYMKVTTAGTGISVQELTQGAQQRAKNLLEISDNPQTFKNAINIMRQEMEFKKKAFAAQKAEIQGRISGGNAAEPAPSADDPYGIR